MSIFKDISHLLHSNDCVILPDFGAFILKSKSAYVENNEFFPPSKYVSFNSMLKDNDGLLAKFISEKKKISYKKSLKLIGVDNFKNLQLAPHIVEELVQSHYKENKKIVSLEGVLLRLAMDQGISRNEFINESIRRNRVPKIISIHSFTPVWKGKNRKIEVGILWDKDNRLSNIFLNSLKNVKIGNALPSGLIQRKK